MNAHRNPGRVRSRSIVLAILAAGVVATSVPALADHESALRVDRTLKGWPIDAFTLVDQHGEALTRGRLLDGWTFVVSGGTRCTQSCTAALSALTALSTRIEGTAAPKNTRVVFISLDPTRDTPAQLAEYLAAYDKRWLAATGSLQTLTRLAEDLGEVGRGPGGSLVLIAPDASVFRRVFAAVRRAAAYRRLHESAYVPGMRAVSGRGRPPVVMPCRRRTRRREWHSKLTP